MIKRFFYFILIINFVFKIFKFLSWPVGHTEKNRSIRMIELVSEFMTSQSIYQTIAINILINILKSKNNQARKFG